MTKVQRLRMAAGLSAFRLGDRSGVSLATLNRLERGYPVSGVCAKLIADVLGVGLWDLVAPGQRSTVIALEHIDD